MTFTFTPSHRGGNGSPMVCLHGFADTRRSWELVLPALERRHEVLALTLPGHAGGSQLGSSLTDDTLVDEVGASRELGIKGFILFGIPSHKDARGSSALEDEGIVQQSLRALRRAAADATVLEGDRGEAGPVASALLDELAALARR